MRVSKGAGWVTTLAAVTALWWYLTLPEQVHQSPDVVLSATTSKEEERTQEGISPSNNSSNSSSDHLPWLVMYVGPMKTGTTTMQDILTGLDEVLAKDKYVYLGRRNQPARWSPLLQFHINGLKNQTCGGMKHDQQCWHQRVLPVLDELQSQGSNLLMHDEWLAKEGNYELLRQAVQNKYRVVIVVGYRRLWDWIASRKNEWEKKSEERWPTRNLTREESVTLPFYTPHAARRPVPSPPFFRNVLYNITNTDLYQFLL